MAQLKRKKNTFDEAAAEFKRRVEELGGRQIGVYVGSNLGIKCKCINDHDCKPRLNHLQNGRGLCGLCPKKVTKIAEQKFQSRLREMGAVQIGAYVNVKTKVICKCINQHICEVSPNCVISGKGICTKCVHHDPEMAETEFRTRITEHKGKVIGKYIGNKTEIECICENGHTYFPTPNEVQRHNMDFGRCTECQIEFNRKRFVEKLEALGVKLVGKFVTLKTKVDCECINGHKCCIVPRYLMKKTPRNVCKICIFESRSQRFADFVKLCDGIQLGKYVGLTFPVLCLCINRHECYPRPGCMKEYIKYKMLPCAKCSQSKGEKIVQDILAELKLGMSFEEFKPQNKVPGMPKCHYDFGNSKVKIEFDGIQHFKKIEHFHKHNPTAFYEARDRDIWKTKIALDNDQTIIRIDNETLEEKGRDYVKQFLKDNIIFTEAKLITTNDEKYKWISYGIELRELVECDFTYHYE
jgi:hypothetical protein